MSEQSMNQANQKKQNFFYYTLLSFVSHLTIYICNRTTKSIKIDEDSEQCPKPTTLHVLKSVLTTATEFLGMVARYFFFVHQL